MKLKFFAVLVVLGIFFAPGCASPNQNAGQIDPATGQTVPPYGPNKTVTGIVAAGTPIAGALPSPYNALAGGILGLATAISLTVAAVKNKSAATANATANQLAASVAAQPAPVAQAILDHASTNVALYPAVAGLVNQNTPG